jgi:hypothetical protein
MAETAIDFNRKNRTITQWLFNPFYYLAGFKALGIGIIVILTTGCFAFLGNSRFNGVLDFHTGLQRLSLWISISEGLVAWLLLSVLLLISGKIISKSRIRIIDIFGTQALARFPYIFCALAAMIPGVNSSTIRFTQSLISNPNAIHLFSMDMLAFIFMMIIVIVMAIWMVALMYQAFATSCNVSGKKAITAFIVSLLIAETISIIVIHNLPGPIENQTTVTTQIVDLASKANKFVTLLSWGEYQMAENMFDDKMKIGLPEKKLKETWESLITQFGPFKAQGSIKQTKILGHDVLFVPCQFERTSLDCQIAFDTKRRIAGLYFRPSANK